MTRRIIKGSRAVVTGASSGIGRALAVALAGAGARLILVARRRDLLETLADQIERLGGQTCLVAGDVTEATVRAEILERAKDRYGGLDVLVNNAGVSAHGRFETASPERLRRIMEVNFFAPAELIRAALPLLREGRRPAVVNVASILGQRGIPHNSEYCASKFALCGLSEALRAEFARLGIDLLLVSPGPTETELFDHLLEQEGPLPWAAQRGLPPQRVADAVVRALRSGKHRIVPHARGRLLLRLNRICPRAVDWWMARYG